MEHGNTAVPGCVHGVCTVSRIFHKAVEACCKDVQGRPRILILFQNKTRLRLVERESSIPWMETAFFYLPAAHGVTSHH